MTARMARRRPSHVASRRLISRARDGLFCGGGRGPLVVAPAGAGPPRPEAPQGEVVRTPPPENEGPEGGVLPKSAHYWPAQEALAGQGGGRRAEERPHPPARSRAGIY